MSATLPTAPSPLSDRTLEAPTGHRIDLIPPEPRDALRGTQSDAKVHMGAASLTSGIQRVFLGEAGLHCIFTRRLDRCSTFSQNWSRLRTAKAQRKVVGNARLSAAACETAVNRASYNAIGSSTTIHCENLEDRRLCICINMNLHSSEHEASFMMNLKRPRRTLFFGARCVLSFV
jgi:hypothetical protein